MGQIGVTEFITLDGVAEDPGGSESLAAGGWAFQFDRGKRATSSYTTRCSQATRTCSAQHDRGFAQAWPSRTGDFADRFNALPKYVVPKTLDEGDWGDTTILRSELSAEIAQLRKRHDRDILVSGSIALVRSLLAADLVDELRLMVFPDPPRHWQATVR